MALTKIYDRMLADDHLSDLTATATELNHVDGVTSGIQTQIDGKASSGHTHTASGISDLTATAAELNYTTDVTSLIQAQIDGKASTGSANTFTANQTFAEFTETVYTLTGTVLDPGNGGVQSLTLTGAVTLTETVTTGQSIILMISGAAANALTFPTITWVTSAGNVAPVLTDSATVVVWKVGSTLYGAYVGSFV